MTTVCKVAAQRANFDQDIEVRCKCKRNACEIGFDAMIAQQTELINKKWSHVGVNVTLPTRLKQAAPDNEHELARQAEDAAKLANLLKERPDGFDARQRHALREHRYPINSPAFNMPDVPDTLKTCRLPDPPEPETPDTIPDTGLLSKDPL